MPRSAKPTTRTSAKRTHKQTVHNEMETVRDEQQDTANRRDRIAQMYGHGPTEPVADTTTTVDTQTTNGDDPRKDVALDPPSVVPSGIDIPTGGRKTMDATLTYKGLSKSGKYALYSGTRTITRWSITNFPDSKPPQTLQLSGELAGPREKLTKEQRAEARKNRPKLTIAERIAKERKRLAKLEAQAAAETAEPVPVMA